MTDTTNVQASDDVQLKHLSRSEYPPLLRVSDILRRIVGFIGTKGSWLIIPLVLITCLDITGRKLIWRDDDGGVYGLQIWLVETFGRVFESTLMQELEWHFHTGLWVLVLGYGYISNTHVRVDLVRETLHMRKKAWIEILGVTFFLIPYICIVTWFAFVYAYDSFLIGEISASQVGLSHRWIIKSIIVFGFITALLAGFSVWLQVLSVLMAPKHWRFPMMTMDWPESEGDSFEGKERVSLDNAVDELARRAAAAGGGKDSATSKAAESNA